MVGQLQLLDRTEIASEIDSITLVQPRKVLLGTLEVVGRERHWVQHEQKQPDASRCRAGGKVGSVHRERGAGKNGEQLDNQSDVAAFHTTERQQWSEQSGGGVTRGGSVGVQGPAFRDGLTGGG